MHVRVSVALALVQEKGRWLVGKRSAGRPFEGLWEFPGGKVHPGETPSQAAVREALEETGLAVEPVQDLGSVESLQLTQTVILHLILCHPAPASCPTDAHPCDPAVAEIRWVSPDELLTLPMPPANAEVLSILFTRFPGPA